MITVLTTMRYSNPMDRNELIKSTRMAVGLYHDVPGLIRKYFCIAADNKSMMGVYLWERKDAFEKKFTPEWKADIARRQGAEPEIVVFDTVAIADNAARNISRIVSVLDF